MISKTMASRLTSHRRRIREALSSKRLNVAAMARDQNCARRRSGPERGSDLTTAKITGGSADGSGDRVSCGAGRQ